MLTERGRMNNNFLIMTDSYKAGHINLFPENLEKAYAYFESRGGTYESTIFFGLQAYLMAYLEGQVFTLDDVDEAEAFWTEHFGRDDYFRADAWRALYLKHGGTLPLEIKAINEGTLVPVNNVLFTVENTDPEFPWLTGWVETLLMKVWYPTTIATQEFMLKRELKGLLHTQSDTLAGLDFMVHDFGYRGTTSESQAEIGGAAHLLSFRGTDTTAGIRWLQAFYMRENDDTMLGFSIPAFEHSVVMSWRTGRRNELNAQIAAFAQALTKYPTGLIAFVCDTYDLDFCVENIIGGALRDRIKERDGTVVIRPDSGDPQEVVLNTLESLGRLFGTTRNSSGNRVLDSHVRVINGDGMTPKTIVALYKHIVKHGWSPENLVVGAGGGMLQSVNRDTQRFAYKVSSVTMREGGSGIYKEYAVAKKPKTDLTKASKAGRFVVARNKAGRIATFNTLPAGLTDELKTVFLNGKLTNVQHAPTIIERMNAVL